MDSRGVTDLKVTHKNENGDLIADSYNIFNRWKNYFSQLLNVNRVSDFRQIEIQLSR
jgi:hypothetical protein